MSEIFIFNVYLSYTVVVVVHTTEAESKGNGNVHFLLTVLDLLQSQFPGHFFF